MLFEKFILDPKQPAQNSADQFQYSPEQISNQHSTRQHLTDPLVYFRSRKRRHLFDSNVDSTLGRFDDEKKQQMKAYMRMRREDKDFAETERLNNRLYKARKREGATYTSKEKMNKKDYVQKRRENA